MEKIRLEIFSNNWRGRASAKMYNSKIWKHFKTLCIEIFQNKVEFKCWLPFVIIKRRINVYAENEVAKKCTFSLAIPLISGGQFMLKTIPKPSVRGRKVCNTLQRRLPQHTWLAESVELVILNLKVLSSDPRVGMEPA